MKQTARNEVDIQIPHNKTGTRGESKLETVNTLVENRNNATKHFTTKTH